MCDRVFCHPWRGHHSKSDEPQQGYNRGQDDVMKEIQDKISSCKSRLVRPEQNCFRLVRLPNHKDRSYAQQLVYLKAGARSLREVIAQGLVSGVKEEWKEFLLNLE